MYIWNDKFWILGTCLWVKYCFSWEKLFFVYVKWFWKYWLVHMLPKNTYLVCGHIYVRHFVDSVVPRSCYSSSFIKQRIIFVHISSYSAFQCHSKFRWHLLFRYFCVTCPVSLTVFFLFRSRKRLVWHAGEFDEISSNSFREGQMWKKMENEKSRRFRNMEKKNTPHKQSDEIWSILPNSLVVRTHVIHDSYPFIFSSLNLYI